MGTEITAVFFAADAVKQLSRVMKLKVFLTSAATCAAKNLVGFIGQSPLLLALVILFWHNIAKAAEPEIIGSLRYSNQVHQALSLLKVRDTNAYAIMTNYVGRIKEGDHSGMWAYSTPPTYEMSDTTAFYSLTWCAATIAHDSFHSKLYHDYQQSHRGPVPDEIWSGRAAEQKCMKHQLIVMQHIGATQLEIDWAKKQADGHYAKENESWDDFNHRKW